MGGVQRKRVPAPGWIADALTATEASIGVGDVELAPLASELLDRLPLARMLAAATEGISNAFSSGGEHTPDRLARAAVANVVAVLSDPGGEVMEFAEIYFDAAAALMAAGVPHSIEHDAILSLGGRIRWLARQRPTALELEALHRTIAQLRNEISKGGS